MYYSVQIFYFVIINVTNNIYESIILNVISHYLGTKIMELLEFKGYEITSVYLLC
jgi:hypothetical protein